MGEESDPLTTEKTVHAVHPREFVVLMFVLIATGTIAGFTFGGSRVGWGILIGGFLAVVNYLWLERSMRALFERRAVSSTIFLAAKYILRYVALGTVLLLLFLTEAVPMAAVIAGLSAFAVAVVIQGLRSIFTSSF